MKTSKTKPVWGLVAVVGLVVAFATIENSVIIALSGAALLAAGAYMGGYMTGDATPTDAKHGTGTQAGERRAA